MAGALPPAVDTVLAWTVREGVTNVIRHSRARQCTIQVRSENGNACVEVINDGYREKERETTRVQTGSGLSGLTERVTDQRGLVEVGPRLFEGNPGFRLWVGLPIQDSETDEREQQR
jgi:two-component system sensor histidine kinase DesK